jgi:predicted phage terminase large subunit-like protein
MGERTWAALFQQSPQPPAGSIFDVSKLNIKSELANDPNNIIVRAWDLAATAPTGMNDPDWTVGLKLAKTDDDTYIVVDVVRLRGLPHEVEQAILQTADQDGQAVRIGLPVDPGQAGKSQVANLTRRLSGYHVVSSREIGSKSARAAPVASQWNIGNIAIIRSKWNHAFVTELRDFPSGSKDDHVDALARAFGLINVSSRQARILRVPFIMR